MATDPNSFAMSPEQFAELYATGKAVIAERKDRRTAVSTVVLPPVTYVQPGETPAQAHLRLQQERSRSVD